MKFNNLPKYAPNNDSVLPKHDELNPGPEMSKYDVQRHEQFKMRYPKRIFTTRNRLPALDCQICGKSITSGGITVSGKHFHGECYLNASS